MSDTHTTETLTLAEAAVLLDCSPRTVERFHRDGRLNRLESPGGSGFRYLASEVHGLAALRERFPAHVKQAARILAATLEDWTRERISALNKNDLREDLEAGLCSAMKALLEPTATARKGKA